MGTSRAVLVLMPDLRGPTPDGEVCSPQTGPAESATSTAPSHNQRIIAVAFDAYLVAQPSGQLATEALLGKARALSALGRGTHHEGGTP